MRLEPYQLAPRDPMDDIPFIMPLYDRRCADSLIACPSPASEWRRGLELTAADSNPFNDIFIIETPDARSIGYVTILYELWDGQFRIDELNLIEGQSYRAVLPTILRWVKPIAEAAANDQHTELKALYFMFGEQHPLYDAAPDRFQKIKPPYAWYVRVPDMAKFINALAPARGGAVGAIGVGGLQRRNESERNMCAASS